MKKVVKRVKYVKSEKLKCKKNKKVKVQNQKRTNKMSMCKSIMEVVVCRGKTILNYQWVKFLKWKNPSMMNIADGLRYFLAQQTKVEIRPQVGTIKASRICMLTRAVISIIQIQLLTKGISQELVHPKISIWQRKKRKIYFFTHRERVEQHSIVQRMNLLS